MKLKPITNLCIIIGALAVIGYGQRPSTEPKIEIYIPNGMPIRIEVERDYSDLTITKYIIKRTVGPEVNKVTMVSILVGPNSEIKHDNDYTTARVKEQASTAWAASEDIHRLILIVERVETDAGAWVLDTSDQRADRKAIVERGADAVPKARFIAK